MLLSTLFFCMFQIVIVQNMDSEFSRIQIAVANLYAETEGKITSLAALQMAEKDLRDRGVIGDYVLFT